MLLHVDESQSHWASIPLDIYVAQGKNASISSKCVCNISALGLWSIMSKYMTLGRGEHHTKGTGRDEKERVLANALAVGLTGTEDRR